MKIPKAIEAEIQAEIQAYRTKRALLTSLAEQGNKTAATLLKILDDEWKAMEDEFWGFANHKPDKIPLESMDFWMKKE